MSGESYDIEGNSSIVDGDEKPSSDVCNKSVANIFHLFDRPIAFHRIFVTITGSIVAALLLSQAMYWQRRTKDPDGWWWKTMDEWTEETGLTRREQETARRELREIGVLEERRRGSPARLYFRVNLNCLDNRLHAFNVCPEWRKAPIKNGGKRQSRMAESANLDCTDPPIKIGGKRQSPHSYTETTAQITSETTTTTCADADAEPQQHDERPRSSSGCDLIFDFSLAGTNPAQQRRAAKILEGLDTETAQQVLDELNEALGRGIVQKSRWAYLVGVAKAARAGTFIPTSDLAERRQKQAQASATVKQQRQRTPSAVWQACRNELQTVLNGSSAALHIPALRGVEDGETLWIEAQNPYVEDDVRSQMPMIEAFLKQHTPLKVQLRIG